jgi:hypothetical protein
LSETAPPLLDAGPSGLRLAISSGVWGVVVMLVGVGSLLATSSGVDASKGQASLLETASGFLTIAVGVLFVVAGQRLRLAAENPSRWSAALAFLALAIQAQIAIVLPAIATTVFFALQGR